MVRGNVFKGHHVLTLTDQLWVGSGTWLLRYLGMYKNMSCTIEYSKLNSGPGVRLMAMKQIPAELLPPAGSALIFQTRASGVQTYSLQLDASGNPAWVLKGPQAELRNAQGSVIGTHYFGPTWKLNDGSELTAKVVARADSSDESAIPWLLLEVTYNSGKGVLGRVTAIQRIYTCGGQPPGGANPTDVGKEMNSAYTADYCFFGRK